MTPLLATGAGDVAHAGADSGNPVKVGARALSAFPTAVATTQRANNISDLFGRQLVTHIDAGMQTWKTANYTSAQTGANIWTPASGKKLAVTYFSVSAYATTAARCILWYAATGTTAYSAGTHQALWIGSFAPTASSKPGVVGALAHPVFCTTADFCLKITTDAALSVDITVHGYEF